MWRMGVCLATNRGLRLNPQMSPQGALDGGRKGWKVDDMLGRTAISRHPYIHCQEIVQFVWHVPSLKCLTHLNLVTSSLFVFFFQLLSNNHKQLYLPRYRPLKISSRLCPSLSSSFHTLLLSHSLFFFSYTHSPLSSPLESFWTMISLETGRV